MTRFKKQSQKGHVPICVKYMIMIVYGPWQSPTTPLPSLLEANIFITLFSHMLIISPLQEYHFSLFLTLYILLIPCDTILSFTFYNQES